MRRTLSPHGLRDRRDSDRACAETWNKRRRTKPARIAATHARGLGDRRRREASPPIKKAETERRAQRAPPGIDLVSRTGNLDDPPGVESDGGLLPVRRRPIPIRSVAPLFISSCRIDRVADDDAELDARCAEAIPCASPSLTARLPGTCTLADPLRRTAAVGRTLGSRGDSRGRPLRRRSAFCGSAGSRRTRRTQVLRGPCPP